MRQRKTNKKVKIANSSVNQVKCQRTGYENTTQYKQDQEIRTKDSKIETNYEVKQYANDARSSERLLNGKHTYSGRTDICCTDEATRGKYRDTEGGEGKGN